MNGRISRRSFNRALVLGAGAAIAAGCGRRPRLPEGSRIGVVGAGFAGIAAAQTLRALAYRPTVLESSDRVGGRVHTASELGTPVDFGASWLHGGPGNPLKKVAQDAAIPVAVTDYNSGLVYGSAGAGPEEIRDSLGSFVERLYASDAPAPNDPEMSLADLFEAVEREAGGPSLSTCIGRRILESLSASPLDQLGVATLLTESRTGGTMTEGSLLPEGELYVTGGMTRVLEQFMEGLEVRLDTAVSKVEDTGSGVVLHTQDAELDFDAVIVTVSVGVLQSGSLRFEPELPAAHRLALSKLEMGTMNKVAMRFPTVFWPEDRDLLALCEGLYSSYWNLHKYADKPVLIGLGGGAEAVECDSLSLEEAVSRSREDLSRALGIQVPEPEAALTSAWLSNPHTLGSYSHLVPGATGDERKQLAEPVSSRVYLAGEATDPTDPETVHGAYWSGERAAHQIAGVV